MAFTFRLAAHLAVCFADTETQPYRSPGIRETISSFLATRSHLAFSVGTSAPRRMIA
jgi:hypothetical protein